MVPLGGAALVLGFVLLYQRRAPGCVAACALQGWVVALAAAWQASVEAEPQLYLAAAATLAANGVLLPRVLARGTGRPGPLRAEEPALGVAASMLLGLLLVVVAALAVRPAIRGGGLMRENLAVALSVMLLGVGVMITWRNPLSQVAGLLSLENGLILGVVGVPAMPMAVELAVAVLAMGALAVLGLSVRARGPQG